jgi:hypothetical protein
VTLYNRDPQPAMPAVCEIGEIEALKARASDLKGRSTGTVPVGRRRGIGMKLPRSNFAASGSDRCRPAGGPAVRKGAKLFRRTGWLDCRLWRWQRARRRRDRLACRF